MIKSIKAAIATLGMFGTFVGGLLIGAAIGHYAGKPDSPDPCTAERQIAFDDGYTLGDSDTATRCRKRHPEDFREDRP